VQHHGYGVGDGDQLLVMCNPVEGETIRGLRAGQGTPASPFDFIPSQDAPAYLTDLTIIGSRAPAEFNGLRIVGSYGDAWIVEDHFVPVGYVIAVATGGPNSISNPLGFREHRRPELRGLIQIPGDNKDYPLLNSYYVRGHGIGVRHRGAAAVMQVTANATYTAPAGM